MLIDSSTIYLNNPGHLWRTVKLRLFCHITVNVTVNLYFGSFLGQLKRNFAKISPKSKFKNRTDS